LVECLEELSARWRCSQLGSGPPPRSPLDQAIKYARQLRELHERCTNDAEFRLDVLGYSSEMSFVHERDDAHEDGNRYKNDVAVESRNTPNGDLNNGYTAINQGEPEPQLRVPNSLLQSAHIPPELSDHNNNQNPPSLTTHQPTSHPHPRQQLTTAHYPNTRDNTLTPPPGSGDILLPSTPYPAQQRTHLSHPHHYHQHSIPPPSASSDDELSLISHTLMGQQFLEMDRVISFDDTTFVVDCMGGGAAAGVGGGGQNEEIEAGWVVE
jgi:hypothetical protein